MVASSSLVPLPLTLSFLSLVSVLLLPRPALCCSLSRLAPDLLIPHLGHPQGPVILELRVSTCSKYRAKGEPDHDVVKLILGPVSGFSVGYLIINASTHYDNPFSFICLSVSGSIGSHLFSSRPPLPQVLASQPRASCTLEEPLWLSTTSTPLPPVLRMNPGPGSTTE